MLDTSEGNVDMANRELQSAVRPPVPEGLQKAKLSENSQTVLGKRYLRRGDDGKPIETIEEMFWRVAYHVARAEEQWGADVLQTARGFHELLSSKRFFPNSPTFTGSGTPLGQLAACFVLPISDDMGRESSGIFQTLRNAALIQQTGGGNGFSFSRLRHKGSFVNSSAGHATGPVGFLGVYDKAFSEIAQGGTRRGANMAVLRVDHPDIREFITCKENENQITNFNISVGLSDAFMEAVENDTSYDLIAPHDGEVVESVPAREIFDLIVRYATNNGEPGVLFLDQANRHNPVPHLYELEATNPCGEQWLGPYENCCLGSINLAQHIGKPGEVDWEKLRETVMQSTRFLDDVVSINAYVPAVPQLKEAAFQARRIGLGIMGLADLMYHVGIGYDSHAGREFAAQVMEFISYHAYRTSIKLAGERGAFPAITGSIYDPQNITWDSPQPIEEFVRDFNRPPILWKDVIEGIKSHGIRNATLTTIAPTGTIATVAGCEGYGCEPVFALAYDRHVDDHGEDLKLRYTSPLFAQALIEEGIGDEEREGIIERVMESGTIQNEEALPESFRRVFMVSQDISVEGHVLMQAALQAFVDNSLSKTCNFPSGASEADVANVFKLAWKTGCKGLTVYVTGSRSRVVLETLSTSDQQNAVELYPTQHQVWQEGKKPRPQKLNGVTYQMPTPLGKAFVTINHNGNKQPFEVFITTAKAGSETAAVSEAMGRLTSYILRLASPLTPRDRLSEVVRQLAGIGGGHPTGFGPNRVLSLPDGLARALAAYLGEVSERSQVYEEERASDSLLERVGDLCPECGAPALVNEEGCRKCYSCGYSEC